MYAYRTKEQLLLINEDKNELKTLNEKLSRLLKYYEKIKDKRDRKYYIATFNTYFNI